MNMNELKKLELYIRRCGECPYAHKTNSDSKQKSCIKLNKQVQRGVSEQPIINPSKILPECPLDDVSPMNRLVKIENIIDKHILIESDFRVIFNETDIMNKRSLSEYTKLAQENGFKSNLYLTTLLYGFLMKYKKENPINEKEPDQ